MHVQLELARLYFYRENDRWFAVREPFPLADGEDVAEAIARNLVGWGKRKTHRVSDQGRGPGVFDVFTARWRLVNHARLRNVDSGELVR